MSNSLEILDPFDIYTRGQAPRCDQQQMLNPAYTSNIKNKAVLCMEQAILGPAFIYIFWFEPIYWFFKILLRVWWKKHVQNLHQKILDQALSGACLTWVWTWPIKYCAPCGFEPAPPCWVQLFCPWPWPLPWRFKFSSSFSDCPKTDMTDLQTIFIITNKDTAS